MHCGKMQEDKKGSKEERKPSSWLWCGVFFLASSQRTMLFPFIASCFFIFVCRAEGPGCTEAETQGCLETLGAGLSGQAWAAARALTHKHPRCVNAWHCQGAAAFLSGYAEAAVDAYRQVRWTVHH